MIWKCTCGQIQHWSAYCKKCKAKNPNIDSLTVAKIQEMQDYSESEDYWEREKS